MSNRKYSKNNTKNEPSQTVPGNPLQQMWHVLTFHEKRFNILDARFKELKKENIELKNLINEIKALNNSSDAKSLKQQVQLEISE